MRQALFALALLTAATGPLHAQQPAGPATAAPARLAFTSLPFEDGGIIPERYTNNVPATPGSSFPLSWTNVPAGTQSFVLLMNDVDANNFRNMSGNEHWLAFNIPATVTSLPAGVPKVPQLPDGTIQPRRGTAPNYVHGYVGPAAPPPNYHHYSIEL